MDKVLIIVMSLLVGFYSGLAYYGYSHQEKDQMIYDIHTYIKKLDEEGVKVYIVEK